MANGNLNGLEGLNGKTGQRGWTPIQGRIMEMLSDGGPKTREQLLECLQDSEGEAGALAVHLTCLRRLINPRGYDITCRLSGGASWYRLVRFI